MQKSMVENATRRLGREDWLKAALQTSETGIESIKIAPLAAAMGVTTGSFYWHFRNRRELLDELLVYWERELTDAAIESARRYEGSATGRILFLMETVMVGELARFDLPIWSWAQTDSQASHVFRRVLKKRFTFAQWMFSEAGFSREQAEVRGRMMVTYMMGESTLIPDAMAKRKERLKLKQAILVVPQT
jgi:AcrR family transcriptional regulator